MALLWIAGCAWARDRFVPGEIVIGFRSATAKSQVDRLMARHALKPKRKSLLPDTLVVESDGTPAAKLAVLRMDPLIAYAERNRYVTLAETIPNDPGFGSQWQFRNAGQSGGSAGADVKASFAWDVTTGSATTVIGITDTGVDLPHAEFQDRLWVNPGEIPGNGIDDDGNSFVDDVLGWNFADGNNDIYDVLGHGTPVAGQVGAATNNAAGASGMDWNARLLIVKIFGASGDAPEDIAVNGVIYAIDNGATIVNASWGDYQDSPLLADMARYAQAHGALICAAAGNSHMDADIHPFFPACTPFDSILAVGGTDRNDRFVYNYGTASVGISAPALDVMLVRKGSYCGTGSGTSYGSPLVAGTAGLVAAIGPSVRPEVLKFRIMAAADQPHSLMERNASSGRLNAHRAVTAPHEGAPEAIRDLKVERFGYNGVVLRFTAPAGHGPLGRASFYQARVSTEPVTSGNFYTLPAYPVYIHPGIPGTVQQFLLNDLDEDTTYCFALRAVDASGEAGDVSNPVSVHLPSSTPLFYDSCDTTSSAWTADGFTLAPGAAHTGIMSWQDSPGRAYDPSTTVTLTSRGFDLRGIIRPRLSFYMQHMFPPTRTGGDGLDVQASTDSLTWHSLRKYHANSPMRKQVLPLDTFAGASALGIRFLFFSDADDSTSDDGVCIDDIRLYAAGSAVPEFREQMVESTDFFGVRTAAPAYREFPDSGAWTSHFGARSQAPRSDYYTATWAVPGMPGVSARFSPVLGEPGLYEVYTTWGPYASASGVEYHIAHSGGVTTVRLDQAPVEADEWVSLGKFRFDAGQAPAAASVTLDVSHASGSAAYSDTVRFRLATLDDVLPAAASGWGLFD